MRYTDAMAEPTAINISASEPSRPHDPTAMELPVKTFVYFLVPLDLIALEASYAFAYMTVPLVRRVFFQADTIIDSGVAIGLAILMPIVWMAIMQIRHLYSDPARTSLMEICVRLLQTTALGLSTLTFVLFAFKQEEFSRLLLFIFCLYSFVMLLMVRAVVKFYFINRHRAGYYSKNIMVVGTAEDAHRLQTVFADHDPLSQYTVVGHINTGPAPNGPHADTLTLGGIENLNREIARQEVSEVLLVWDARGVPELDRLLQTCQELGKRVRLIPRFALSEVPTVSTQAESFWGLPSITVSTLRRAPEQVFVKRFMDIFGSAVLLIILSPLLVWIVLAVKCSSPGPVLYRWRVLGRNNREFVGYKFRTMVANADELKASLLNHNEMDGPVFKMKNDPRVTPLGRFLRKYSLDELPQLWSVLVGDMSLVGPRPVFRSEFERFQFWQMRKLSVRPGITCLWQVNGRNQISDINDWIRLDLKYIDEWSLWLDLKILAQTALVVLKGTGH